MNYVNKKIFSTFTNLGFYGICDVIIEDTHNCFDEYIGDIYRILNALTLFLYVCVFQDYIPQIIQRFRPQPSPPTNPTFLNISDNEHHIRSTIDF